MSGNTLYFGHNVRDPEHPNNRRLKPELKNPAISLEQPSEQDCEIVPNRILLSIILSNGGKEAVRDVCVDVFVVGGKLPDGNNDLDAVILRNITKEAQAVSLFEGLTVPGRGEWKSPFIEWVPSHDHRGYCIALARAYRKVNGQVHDQPSVTNPALDFQVAVRRFLLESKPARH